VDESEDEAEVDVECDHSKEHTNFYGNSKGIGTLWAAVQTELLTYRRRVEGDPWISDNFSMVSLVQGLNSGAGISIPLVEKDMMEAFHRYGRFYGVWDEACSCMSEACSHYFANMEERNDSHRCTFTYTPENRTNFWYF
jgi:hypothetical protein